MLEQYKKWTNEFLESWKALDYERVLATLDKEAKYYENPIDEACQSFDEVINLWNVVADNQKDIDYQYKIIAYDHDVCIINW